MSITTILNLASAGLSNAQAAIATSNANIANASQAGATKKTYQATAPMTTKLALNQGEVTRAADSYLQKSVVSGAAAAGSASAINDYMGYYDADLGTVDSGADLSSLLDSLQSAVSSLATSPDDESTKASVVSAADSLASGINGLSTAIQGLRTQANNQISDVIGSINSDLSDLDDLNKQIAQGTLAGSDVTDLEDQRDTDLQDLSSKIGINYFIDSSNRAVVFTTSGDSLLGSSASSLSYAASSQLDASTEYPSSISGIILNGTDITTSITSGELGGLITLRDNTFVSEQEKLDTLASSLINAVNTVSNGGSAVPAPQSLTSNAALAGTDTLSATGTARLAIVSSTGTAVSYKDIDLSTLSTVNDLIGAINGAGGMNASIGADGKLTITSDDSSDGIAIANQSSAVGVSGQGLSTYFGFNNLFQGSDASTVAVSAALKSDPSGLQTASLSSSASLANGTVGLSASDTSVSSALLSAFNSQRSFAAAGDFSAKTNTLSGYASDFVSRAATLVSSASSKASTTQSTLSYVQNTLQNTTGINIDEEMALVTQYQNQYEANAQIITIARSLFQDLITMVS